MEIFNKKINKFMLFVLITFLFFSFSPAAYAASEKKDFTKMLEEIVVETMLKVADGIFYVISASVGEIVSTEEIIYNHVDKLDVNYWELVTDEGVFVGSDDTIKGVMGVVVRKWYAVFLKIATIVYMMVLVVAGIQVLLHSTADKKAQYKEYLVSWVTGVMILFLFPYVMKYIVKLNEAAVGAMESYGGPGDLAGSAWYVLDDSILEKSRKEEIQELFGSMEFVEELIGDDEITEDDVKNINDPMLQTRVAAQIRGSIVLMIVYFILIGQTIVLLFMYYKRAFMLAFIITIFPLVAMTYAVDKMGDKKAQSFGIWFKEFVVNVIVQTFHAIVYVVLVKISIDNYILHEGENWIFMIISVLFLFQGEKILRNIFSINSKANTLGTLAASGALMLGSAKKLIEGKGGGNNIASQQDAADNKAASNRLTFRTKMGEGGVSAPEVATGDGGSVTAPSPSTRGPEDAGQYRGNDPAGVNSNGFDIGAAQDTVLQGAMARRLKRGMASGLVRGSGRLIGGVAGATYGLSQGDSVNKKGEGGLLGNAVAQGYKGSAIGEGVTAPITAGVNKLERRIEGNILANRISSGKEDQKLGIPQTAGNILPPDIDEDEIIARQGVRMQDIYREALAEMARATARGGRAKGEVAFWNYIEKHTSDDK